MPRRMVIAICVFCSAITGCVESSFNLARQSRLPKCLALPPGLAREDISVKLNFYAPLRGPDAKFILTYRNGRKLAQASGRSTLLRGFEVVAVNGTTEIVELNPATNFTDSTFSFI